MTVSALSSPSTTWSDLHEARDSRHYRISQSQRAADAHVHSITTTVFLHSRQHIGFSYFSLLGGKRLSGEKRSAVLTSVSFGLPHRIAECPMSQHAFSLSVLFHFSSSVWQMCLMQHLWEFATMHTGNLCLGKLRWGFDLFQWCVVGCWVRGGKVSFWPDIYSYCSSCLHSFLG